MAHCEEGTADFKPRPMTVEELEQALQQIWAEKITQEFCINYINSMPHRIELIIQCNGDRIPY